MLCMLDLTIPITASTESPASTAGSHWQINPSKNSADRLEAGFLGLALSAFEWVTILHFDFRNVLAYDLVLIVAVFATQN